ncbi:isoaspartyl peptidase/L-asparaginase [Methylobacterium sp. J-001]|uniref:isoaspartyl peptidase/L-asparaginase family protein n=1 Tax=Methylobacterium sp. J-001 TaxID=2836609 RepID=UPI001FBA40DA|nr:isoaspartyl peptidase/L-asparaginase [Methylobacterium sp. J-001]MCJ2120240.1 isoaspartyl peptidase/L-asparaginase [Methylobacterium sp. J-001]
MSDHRPVLVIHGGAGTIAQGQDDLGEARYHAALADILAAGAACLAAGGSALDAVSVAVDLLEECPLFNAGRGAVFTSAETHELDAAIMDGATLRAGAVASVSRVRRPGRAARAVMEAAKHVLMAGAGAEAFARRHGLEMVEPDFFSTEARRDQLRRARAAGQVALDHDAASGPLDETRKFGTVGAVALDRNGHLAALTSTGGMTNKRPGRIGDSPLIGAGTYADDRTAAVSCTGTGEAFIRVAAAHDVCARMAYGGQDLEAATRAVVEESLPSVGGRGGLIAVDGRGQVAMPFNTEGMYRGLVRPGEMLNTAIFGESRRVPASAR